MIRHFQWIATSTIIGMGALLGQSIRGEVDLTVDGTGWLQDIKIERAVSTLTDAKKRDTLDANAVEEIIDPVKRHRRLQGGVRLFESGLPLLPVRC